MLPFLGIQLLNRSPQIETKVYVKPTIQVYSCTVRVMSTIGAKRVYWELCLIEHTIYLHLRHIFPTNVTVWKQYSHGWSIYAKHLVNSTSRRFVDSKVCDQQQPLSPSQEPDDTIRVVIPFKDQISADIVKKQLKDLSLKVHTTIQPVFVSRNIEQELNVKETKPPVVNQQCEFYGFQCDLGDAGYLGFTSGHLHNRVMEHKQQFTAIAKHYKNMHRQCLRAC